MVFIPGYKTFLSIRFASSPVIYDQLRKNICPDLQAVYLYRDERTSIIIAKTKVVICNFYHSVLCFLVPL